MTVLICDSSSLRSRMIEEELEHILEASAEEATAFHFCRTEDMEEYLSVSPDAAEIAVISLEEYSGLSYAEQLRTRYPDIRLVLTGGEPGNVERLFEIGTSYFLYTPFSDGSLKKCFTHLHDLTTVKEEKHFEVSGKKGVTRIAFSDILYVMSDRRKIIVYQPRGRTDEAYMKLDQVEESLDDRFVRCHQSYLVNMDCVNGILNDGFALIGSIFVPISQNRYWEAKRKYVDYVKRKG